MSAPGRGASFTDEILAELVPHTPPLACCRAAMVRGMALAGNGDEGGASVTTTRVSVARAALKALHLNGLPAHVVRVASPRRATFRVDIEPDRMAVLATAGAAQPCCSRSRLRGAFLVGGSVARPDAPPHLEILCRSREAALVLRTTMQGFAVPVALLRRRGHWMVAVRTAEGVGVTLSTIGAQSGRLRYEDGRVVRELRAGVNRRINAETANLRRTVGAGVHQLAAISALRGNNERWLALPPALREAAALRERHPQDTLDRLASRAACSRSAMADRIRRLLDAAQPLVG